MKKLIAILIILAFASPVRAGLVTDFDPVERKLLDKQFEDEMTKDFKKPGEPFKYEEPKKKGSKWWIWALGGAVVAGVVIAVAGGGGGGGDGDTGTGGGGGTGSTTVTW